MVAVEVAPARRRPNMRLRLMIVMIGWVIISGVVVLGSVTMLVPAWRAAHGGGVTGTFTLTEAMSCDRRQPPRQRCGWFGDFRGADGRTVRHHLELAGGLPPGARVGDTVAARDTGSWAQAYRIGDRGVWRSPAGFLGLALIPLTIGLLVLQPWSWRARFRRARAAGRWRTLADPLS
jgi:hypothetical protein